MTRILLLAALGGALGSALRVFIQRTFNASFPYGTFIVNIGGCLLIGLFWGWFMKDGDDTRRLLLMSGFCGGLTTFSSFSVEGLEMLLQQKWLMFAVYTLTSLITGILATYIGYKISS